LTVIGQAYYVTQTREDCIPLTHTLLTRTCCWTLSICSNRGYLRKKAVLVLYKAFLRYPEALRPAFPRLTEKIEDSDLAVVSAVVTVLCELCIHNPQNYLPMVPTFYKLLQVRPCFHTNRTT